MMNLPLRFLLVCCGFIALSGGYWSAVGITGWGVGACIGWLCAAGAGMIVGSLLGLALAVEFALGWPHQRRGSTAMYRRMWVAGGSGLIFGNVVDTALGFEAGESIAPAIVPIVLLLLAVCTGGWEVPEFLLFGFPGGSARGPRFSRRPVAVGLAAGLLAWTLAWLLGGTVTAWSLAGALGGVVVALVLASLQEVSIPASVWKTLVMRVAMWMVVGGVAGAVAASVGAGLVARTDQVKVPNALAAWFGKNQTLAAAFYKTIPGLALLGLAILVALVVRFKRPRPGAQGERVFFGHRGPVNAVAVTPDGRYAVSGADDRAFRIWDIATAAETCCLEEHDETIEALAVSPDGKLAASADGAIPSEARICLWKLPHGTLHGVIATRDKQPGSTDALAFGADSRSLFVGSSGGGNIIVHRWNVEEPQEPLSIILQIASQSGEPESNVEVDYLRSLSVSSDGKLLLAVQTSGLVRAWDHDEDYEAWSFRLDEGTVLCAAFLPQGKGIIVGDDLGYLHLWESGTNTETEWWGGGCEETTASIVAVAVLPGDQRVVSADGTGVLRVWELETGKPERTPVAEIRLGLAIQSLAVLPTTQGVIIGMGDGTVRLWTLGAGSSANVRPV